MRLHGRPDRASQNVILPKIENFITFKPFDRYAPNLIGVIPMGRAIVCDRSPMGEGRGAFDDGWVGRHEWYVRYFAGFCLPPVSTTVCVILLSEFDLPTIVQHYHYHTYSVY